VPEPKQCRASLALLLTQILCVKGQKTPWGWPVYRRTGRPPSASFCFSAARGLDHLLNSPPAAPLKNKKKGETGWRRGGYKQATPNEG